MTIRATSIAIAAFAILGAGCSGGEDAAEAPKSEAVDTPFSSEFPYLSDLTLMPGREIPLNVDGSLPEGVETPTAIQASTLSATLNNPTDEAISSWSLVCISGPSSNPMTETMPTALEIPAHGTGTYTGERVGSLEHPLRCGLRRPLTDEERGRWMRREEEFDPPAGYIEARILPATRG
ncbi:hypothetical protein [Brevundimonas sp. A19_0]|uniref:hypothetical protein n=1 Tax=Brevundimonas sp. A19_0 TaxID=2821087 RepID=UPI001ADC8B97|nr:hypothetical protein [Brevundimonas sp. A19_0]MBO9500496.1 hypothetical protein [Brevundimonas sp. A19_0]